VLLIRHKENADLKVSLTTKPQCENNFAGSIVSKNGLALIGHEKRRETKARGVRIT
jgi:hypothetical protein